MLDARRLSHTDGSPALGRRGYGCGVPKLCSHYEIITICARNLLPTRYTDDAENSEVDRPDNVTIVGGRAYNAIVAAATAGQTRAPCRSTWHFELLARFGEIDALRGRASVYESVRLKWYRSAGEGFQNASSARERSAMLCPPW